MPDSKLVAFAIREVDEEVIACAEAGIVAYVKRESSSEEMVDILHQAARGDFGGRRGTGTKTFADHFSGAGGQSQIRCSVCSKSREYCLGAVV